MAFSYSGEIILNGNFTLNSNWDLVHASRGVYQDHNCMILEANAEAKISQTIIQADMNTVQDREYLFFIEHYYVPPTASSGIVAFAYVTMNYTIDYNAIDGLSKETFTFPLYYNNNVVVYNEGYYEIIGKCYARVNQVLESITVEVRSYNADRVIPIGKISLKKGYTETETHNDDINPHNLPLTITVSQQGIKGTKGGNIKFWLKDDGDALFAGTLQAAGGTFAGDLQAVGGTFIGALVAATGTFQGQVIAGSIESDTTINVSTDLTVGDNIIVGNQNNVTDKAIRFSNGIGLKTSGTGNSVELENIVNGPNSNIFITSGFGKVFISAGTEIHLIAPSGATLNGTPLALASEVVHNAGGQQLRLQVFNGKLEILDQDSNHIGNINIDELF